VSGDFQRLHVLENVPGPGYGQSRGRGTRISRFRGHRFGYANFALAQLSGCKTHGREKRTDKISQYAQVRVGTNRRDWNTKEARKPFGDYIARHRPFSFSFSDFFHRNRPLNNFSRLSLMVFSRAVDK